MTRQQRFETEGRAQAASPRSARPVFDGVAAEPLNELARDSGLARIRSELEAIRRALDAIDREVARLSAGAGTVPARVRPDRYYALLIELYECGPHGVDEDTLAALGERYMYDRRGLNGFFGGSRATLQRDGGRARLTVEGLRLVTERIEREVAR